MRCTVKQTNLQTIIAACLVGGLYTATTSTVWAAEIDDVTMQVMDMDEKRPDALTRIITLPEAASDTARTHSSAGLARANAARQAAAERAAARQPVALPGQASARPDPSVTGTTAATAAAASAPPSEFPGSARAAALLPEARNNGKIPFNPGATDAVTALTPPGRPVDMPPSNAATPSIPTPTGIADISAPPTRPAAAATVADEIVNTPVGAVALPARPKIPPPSEARPMPPTQEAVVTTVTTPAAEPATPVDVPATRPTPPVDASTLGNTAIPEVANTPVKGPKE